MRGLDPCKKSVMRWEEKNLVFGKGYQDRSRVYRLGQDGRRTYSYGKSLWDNMATRGYDVMRVSPRTTTKSGYKYRAVYGGSVEPNYQYSEKGKKYYPRVNWYKQGYVKAGKTKGTKILRSGLYRDFQSKPLKNMLMK